MATRKFKKALISCLAWVIFLYLLISNWDALKSVWWWNLWETTKISGIGKCLKQNTGDIFFFGLCALFLLLWLAYSYGKIRRGKGEVIPEDQNSIESAEQTAAIGLDEAKFNNNVDIIINPAYRTMSCNIYHRWDEVRGIKKTDA
ncbi:MAG: hypothetical protein PHG20_09675 [Geobacteraceae bacterium]|nr:hypothetical protein [Geobacteraceae bacterium]